MRTIEDLTGILHGEADSVQIQNMVVEFINWKSLSDLSPQKQKEYQRIIEDREYCLKHTEDGFLSEDFQIYFQNSTYAFKTELRRHENISSWQMTDKFCLTQLHITNLRNYLSRVVLVEGIHSSHLVSPYHAPPSFYYIWGK